MLQNDKELISVVIVSWNAENFLTQCLSSLSKETTRTREIIVVDNGSEDGSRELVTSQFPEVKLICNNKNLGFAKANNIGIATATGEYICLVNSDVRFVHDCLTPMLAYMKAHPDVAMLGPKMLDAQWRVGRSTMRFPTVWNSISRALGLDRAFKGSKVFGRQMVSDFDHAHTKDVEVLNGWFLMTRRTALEQVGLLDERFFMYGEDIDWSYRFYQAGWRRVFFAEAEAIHYGGGSSANAPLRFQIEMYRANSQYWLKHYGRAGRAVYLFIVWLHQAIRLLGYLALMAGKSKRSKAAFKVKKSVACLVWLMGFRNSQMAPLS